ncbi:response regulator transcription factor [Sinimarinibacterium sp. CAU 1509]|uniref:response regulator transcription factor n=1 Tax=Sinimarinibacterium sp. CAU 1509 TaxID=2562283 RepID=UPI0010AC8B9D|nr:response regulator transcription factor [Sinimarinibacterium sp. CAU 1509]TJY61990.1 response regulator transcription factor [Sinimarinibacterium sp. CAU 1509]
MRVLLVEDDRLLGASLVEALRRERYIVDWCRTLADARVAVASTQYNIALIDRQLPDGEGLDLIDLLRGSELPVGVLVLTARDEIQQRVQGLDRGADDYMVKPFDLDELLARMRAAARRSADRGPGGVLRVGAVLIDPARRTVQQNGERVELSPRAFALLVTLARHPGHVLTRRQLEEALYPAGDEVESNAVEVHVHQIRRKLGAEIVRTVRGHGYCIADDPA